MTHPYGTDARFHILEICRSPKGLLLVSLVFLLFSTHAFAQDPNAVPAVILREHPHAISDVQTPDAIYRVWLDGRVQTLVSVEQNHTFFWGNSYVIDLDNGNFELLVSELNPTLIPTEPTIAPSEIENLAAVRAYAGEDFTPLVMPRLVHHSVNGAIYVMSNETSTDLNLYLAGISPNLIQLTDVRSLFPDAKQPILSASTELLMDCLCPEWGMFYRARVRDAAGVDHNRIYFYDSEKDTTREMPYFGTDPEVSPDGTKLLGSRLEEADGEPFYAMWIADIKTGEEQRIGYGCNAKWSLDGGWIAYDVHDNAQWQGYTDCFGNGEVEALNLESGEKVSLTQNLDGFVSLIDWSSPVSED